MSIESKHSWICLECGSKDRTSRRLDACRACGGALKLTGTKYYPRIDQGREGGKRVRKSVPKRQGQGGFDRKKEATAAYVAASQSVADGSFVEASKQTTGEYLKEWLASMRAQVRYSTWKGYSSYMRSHVIPELGRIPLQGLSAANLNRLYADLLEGGHRNGKGLSPTSVRQCHVILHRALRDAVKEGRIARNPADLASPPATSRTEMKVWTGEEAHRFLDHVAEDRLYAAWALFLSAGLRRGELAALTWECLDGSQLSIRRTLIQSGWEVRFSEPKTRKSVRSIALDPQMLAILKAHKAAQAQERLTAGPAWEDQNLIFCREDGHPLHPAYISNQFKRLSNEAGVPAIRLQDTRHTFASLALKAKVPAKVVSEILGHSSIAITLDTYSHLLPGLQEEAAGLVARAIFSNE